MAKRIIIVGGGIAAINAIKAIREIDSESEIYLFGREKFYPYNRVRLTKSMFENLEEDKILIRKKDWYAANKVNVFTDKEVVGINTTCNEVILKNGDRFQYYKLLLACGAHNFIPPIDGISKKGVYSIRSLDDVIKLKNNLEHKKEILIIGGGIQGLEMAWILAQHGKRVILAEAQERLMPRQLDKRASSILKEAIEKFNIEILLDTKIKGITGEDDVDGIITSSDEVFKCDMVIYSVGIRSNMEILEDTPVERNNGVIVNYQMETNIKNIYAAGDVAEIDGRMNGLWSIAIEQGKTAGYNIAGRNAVYPKSVPVTTLNAFNISLFSMGNIDEKQSDVVLTEDLNDPSSYKKIFVKDKKIVGAIVFGDNKKSPILKKAIEKETEFLDINF